MFGLPKITFRLTLFGQRVSVSNSNSIVNWWQRHSSRVMSDKRSDTIITVIGSVKNVGMLPIAPPKNVDHATAQRRPPQ